MPPVLQEAALLFLLFLNQGCFAATKETAGAKAGNPSCWRQGYDYNTCCGPIHGPQGNPSCFDLVYTYEFCCQNEGGEDKQSALQDCRAGSDMSTLPRPIQCRGTSWVSADDWDDFFHAHQLSQVLGTSFQGWPNVSSLLAKANASQAALRASEEDCIFGLIAAVLHGLPYIEKQQNTRTALAAYGYAARLRGRAAEMEAEDCRWNKMINHAMFAHYPLLLGDDKRYTRICPEGAPRIFVYNTGDMAEKPFSCSRTGFWASEVYIDRFLRHSACRVGDWRMADLFFVPAYLTCWELQKVSGLSESARKEAAQGLSARVRSLPHWGRRMGYDHVFLFGASAWVLPDWRELLAQSVVLAVESRPIQCAPGDAWCQHCQDCFQPWKDLVVPPVTPRAATERLLANSRPVAERDIIMSWHGQHANASSPSVQHAYRITNETVRLALLELGTLPQVSLGSPTPNYAAVLGNSHFCLCPKGASSYTSRVFEALFAGCVPVILSDDVRLPFDRVVAWEKFSIRWPMQKVDRRLYDYLRNLLQEKPDYVLGLKREVANVRCWFDYFGMEEDPMSCSPYLALLKGLAERVASMPKPPPPFVSVDTN